jgi:hypothetical protein
MYAAVIAFIAAGIYLGWLRHMGRDTKEYDDGSGRGRLIACCIEAHESNMLG